MDEWNENGGGGKVCVCVGGGEFKKSFNFAASPNRGQLLKKEFTPLRSSFERDMSPWEANRKSHKLSPIERLEGKLPP